MTSNAEVSFCVPAYNASANIERCLRGVLAQRVPSREILVVDNCSTDDTVERARTILRDVPEARILINESNLGRVENWNRCLELSAGSYIKFAFTNDVLLPGGTQMLLSRARERPEVVMVCSRRHKVEGVAAVQKPVPRNPPVEIFDSGLALRQLSRYGNNTGSLNGILIQGAAVQRHGLRFRPNIPYCADFYFSIELAGCGSVAYIRANSYLFDSSAKNRYSRSGISRRTRYFQRRECVLLLSELLPKHGMERWLGFEILHKSFARQCCIGGQSPLSRADTLELFKDAGPYLTSAVKYQAREGFRPPKNTPEWNAIKAGRHRLPILS